MKKKKLPNEAILYKECYVLYISCTKFTQNYLIWQTLMSTQFFLLSFSAGISVTLSMTFCNSVCNRHQPHLHAGAGRTHGAGLA